MQDGDDFIINGQKIWTSQAHYADWMFVLARTDPDAPKHRGISYFLLDMKTPGITVRPLINMANGEGFNEVFFENVRVPRSGLLGELNRGWYIATTTLDFERSSIGGTSQALRALEDLTRFAKTEREAGDGRADLGQAARCGTRSPISGSISRWRGCCRIASSACRRAASCRTTRHRSSRCSLGVRAAAGAHRHAASWGCTAASGAKARGRSCTAASRSRTSRPSACAIAGGTSEIQRNIIAQRGLGLPRQ